MNDTAKFKWTSWQNLTIIGLAAALGFVLYFNVFGSGAPTDQYHSESSFLDMGKAGMGVYLVVWEDLHNGNSDIVAALVDPGNKAVKSNFPITAASGKQSKPCIAANYKRKEFLVVWEDERNSIGLSKDLYGQLVKYDGSLIGENFKITEKSYAGCNPAILYNSKDNSYIIVWDDSSNNWTSSDIFGIQISYDGKPIGKTIAIAGSPQTSEHNQNPSLAYNAKQNRFVIAWEEWGSYYPYNYFSIKGKSYDASAMTSIMDIDISPSLPAGTGVNRKYNPMVAYSEADDKFLVVWSELRTSKSKGSYIAGVFIDTYGLKILPEFKITDLPELNETDPSVSSSQLGFLVTYTDEQQKSTQGFNIYAQGVAYDGKLQGNAFPVSNSPFDQYDSYISFSPQSNTYLITWTDRRNLGASGTDIYGQHLTFKGARIQTTSNDNFLITVPKITGQLKP